MVGKVSRDMDVVVGATDVLLVGEEGVTKRAQGSHQAFVKAEPLPCVGDKEDVLERSQDVLLQVIDGAAVAQVDEAIVRPLNVLFLALSSHVEHPWRLRFRYLSTSSKINSCLSAAFL